MKCLLKKTGFGTLAFCSNKFDLKRTPTKIILKCQREHKVEHCKYCKDYSRENKGGKDG